MKGKKTLNVVNGYGKTGIEVFISARDAFGLETVHRELNNSIQTEGDRLTKDSIHIMYNFINNVLTEFYKGETLKSSLLDAAFSNDAEE